MSIIKSDVIREAAAATGIPSLREDVAASLAADAEYPPFCAELFPHLSHILLVRHLPPGVDSYDPSYACPPSMRGRACGASCPRAGEGWVQAEDRAGIQDARCLAGSPHPGGNPGANPKSISHRCYLREVAFE